MSDWERLESDTAELLEASGHMLLLCDPPPVVVPVDSDDTWDCSDIKKLTI